MHYFSIFSQIFNKPCVNFLRVWTKKTIIGKFEKILQFFDENSIEKFNFLFFFIFYFFRKFVTKNRAFGNNTIFLQQFFRFRGGGNFPPSPPGYALGLRAPRKVQGPVFRILGQNFATVQSSVIWVRLSKDLTTIIQNVRKQRK